MMLRANKFIFESYRFDDQRGRLTCRYRFDTGVSFEEQLVFPPAPDGSHQTIPDRLLFGTFIMLGISYYKAAAPPSIEIEAGELCIHEHDFFSQTFLYGLGEFFVRNQIDPRGRISFPSPTGQCPLSSANQPNGPALIGLGGGKDSLVVADILDNCHMPYRTWSLESSPALNTLAQALGQPYLVVNRRIDPELIRLSRTGEVLNGHIPISAILAFVGNGLSFWTGSGDVITGNEASVNQGNLIYHGLAVNHQYSKSLAFETAFQTYLKHSVTPSRRYFSLLRPLTELRIVELFTRRLFSRFGQIFGSCNRNFRIDAKQTAFTWCGTCPKCAFIFIALAPFLPKPQLLKLFGKNLLTDLNLRVTYDQLLGRRDSKPFECVGEIDEVRAAFWLTFQTGDYPELTDWQLTDPHFDYRALRAHQIPKPYLACFMNYLKRYAT